MTSKDKNPENFKPDRSSDEERLMPIAHSVYKKAGELGVVFGRIDELDATYDSQGNQVESKHRKFVLDKEKDPWAFRTSDIRNIEHIPAHLLDDETTDPLTIIHFNPKEPGDVDTIAMIELSDGTIETQIDYFVPGTEHTLADPEKEALAGKAIENIFYGAGHADDGILEAEQQVEFVAGNITTELTPEQVFMLDEQLNELAERLRTRD